MTAEINGFLYLAISGSPNADIVDNLETNLLNPEQER